MVNSKIYSPFLIKSLFYTLTSIQQISTQTIKKAILFQFLVPSSARSHQIGKWLKDVLIWLEISLISIEFVLLSWSSSFPILAPCVLQAPPPPQSQFPPSAPPLPSPCFLPLSPLVLGTPASSHDSQLNSLQGFAMVVMKRGSRSPIAVPVLDFSRSPP